MLNPLSRLGAYTESDNALRLKRGLAARDYISVWQSPAVTLGSALYTLPLKILNMTMRERFQSNRLDCKQGRI